jgi:hypothetical protein
LPAALCLALPQYSTNPKTPHPFPTIFQTLFNFPTQTLEYACSTLLSKRKKKTDFQVLLHLLKSEIYNEAQKKNHHQNCIFISTNKHNPSHPSHAKPYPFTAYKPETLS